MSYQTIAYHQKDHVAFIRINAPVKNRMEMALLSDELNAVCSKVGSDNEIRVAVVTSSVDDAFSLGEELIADISQAEQRTEIKSCALAEPIAGINQPVIAGINGNAVGQGLEMALACDLRISTETSFFGLPHIRVGGIPSDGGIQRLSRLVGKGKALEMVLTGDMIDAQEASQIGLVNKIVLPSELEGAVSDMAHELATKSPFALKYAKESVYKGMDLTLEQGLRLEADLYFLLHTTEDRREGVEAFREKRTPEFKGK
jgi:enoyl-CoA hydratase/carnithine racemase